MGIFDLAMQMELDGKAFYEKLAAETEADGLAKIFTSLAQDEKKHYEVFKALKEQSGNARMKDSEVLEGAKGVFAKLKPEQLAAKLKSNLEAYKYAMKIEADSAKMYQDAAQHESSQEVKSLLTRIAVEEQKHLMIMENVFEFVNAPNQSLVWGEFSNLEEF